MSGPPPPPPRRPRGPDGAPLPARAAAPPPPARRSLAPQQRDPPAAYQTAARPTQPRPATRQQIGGRRQSDPTPKRRKPIVPIAAGLAAVLVLVGAAVAFGALSDGGGGGGKPEKAFKESTVVDLKPGETTIQYTYLGQPIEFPTDAVLGTIGQWIDTGIVNPLRKGKADDAALAAVFDGSALPIATGIARAVMVDEGLPKAVGKVQASAQPVAMQGLASEQKLIIATATIDLQVSAETEQGTVHTARSGLIYLVPDISGTWKIAGWTLHMERDGPGVEPAPTTSTVAPATTGTT